MIEWILNINLNFNQQTQFIENIIDISKTEGVPVAKLLTQPPFSNLWEEKGLNHPQKAKRLLAVLRSRRFPRLTNAEKIFQERVSNLDLPEGIKIYHPPFFEGHGYRMGR